VYVVSTHEQGLPHEGGGEPVWTRPEPGSRRPRYTREQIAAVAVEIADAEGIKAVSMRRVATELEAGTMTLYHYVPTKHALLTLMNDAIAAELLVPVEEREPTWRGALMQIARRSRAAWQRHPWAIGALRDARTGPNAMRHLEQLLAAVADLPLELSAKLSVISIVDDYVLGFVVWGDLVPTDQDSDMRLAIGTYIANQLGTGEFPHLEELLETTDPETVMKRLTTLATADQRFEFGLTCLLDGIAMHLDTRERAT
jgi:AcrR family transcriptional regulator